MGDTASEKLWTLLVMMERLALPEQGEREAQEAQVEAQVGMEEGLLPMQVLLVAPVLAHLVILVELVARQGTRFVRTEIL